MSARRPHHVWPTNTLSYGLPRVREFLCEGFVSHIPVLSRDGSSPTQSSRERPLGLVSMGPGGATGREVWPPFPPLPHHSHPAHIETGPSDPEVRSNVLKSLLLNAVSLASIYFFDLLISPLAHQQQKWLHRNVGWFYQVLWLLPVVGISLYLNVSSLEFYSIPQPDQSIRHTPHHPTLHIRDIHPFEPILYGRRLTSYFSGYLVHAHCQAHLHVAAWCSGSRKPAVNIQRYP